MDHRGRWVTWWRSRTAPRQWRAGHPAVLAALSWREAAPGIETADLRLAGAGEAWRIRAIVVRINPRRVHLQLAFGTPDSLGAGRWRIGDADSALVAFNAGQFAGRRPWGWVVRDRRELQPPAVGPLSAAFALDEGGAARMTVAAGIPALRESGQVITAFQTYPLVLADSGRVPGPLRVEHGGVDLRHRDSRLAIGLLRDSSVLVVLTRFEALGGALDQLPFGLTTPEMAALMGALGCTIAALLDGGISGQLLVRDGHDRRAYPGLRSVPMGMIGTPRQYLPR